RDLGDIRHSRYLCAARACRRWRPVSRPAGDGGGDRHGSAGAPAGARLALQIVLIFGKPGWIRGWSISFFRDCWLMYPHNDNKTSGHGDGHGRAPGAHTMSDTKKARVDEAGEP